MSLNKVLFLDIDGVLNDHTLMSNNHCGIQREKMFLLNYILEQTKAKVVISSAWRYMMLDGKTSPAMTLLGFDYLLRTHGFDGILLGYTASDEDIFTRESQILMWAKNNEVKTFAVVDDLPLKMDKKIFVQTDENVGLTLVEANKLIGILNE